MKTGQQVCEEAGLSFEDGPIDSSEFEALFLPVVVSCRACLMTMAFPSCLVDDEGYCYCSECGAAEENST